jgi:hypothetical protein
MSEDALTKEAWCWDREGGPVFTRILYQKFPDVRNISIETPYASDGMDWYHKPALHVMQELLEWCDIDVLRFFYVGKRDFTEADNIFLYDLVGPLINGDGDASPGPEYEPNHMQLERDVVE